MPAKTMIGYLIIGLLSVCTYPNSAFSWEEIVIVEPKIITVQKGCKSLGQIDRLRNSGIFGRAVDRFKVELADYLSQIPAIRTVKAPIDFYKYLEIEGQDYLNRFIEDNSEDLLICGQVFVDCSEKVFEIWFRGFDPDISGGLLYSVIQAPVSLNDVSYVEELYIQSMFELLNEHRPFH